MSDSASSMANEGDKLAHEADTEPHSSKIYIEEDYEILEYRPETILKAKELSYFCSEKPKTCGDSITTSEYNVVKGLITGPLLMISAPIVCAVEETMKGSDILECAKGCAVGFGRGLLRGTVGGVALIATGTVMSALQVKEGCESTVQPGQGKGLVGNWEHLMESSSIELACNVQPASFDEDVSLLVAEGSLPAVRVDKDGLEVPYKYQYFVDEEPVDFMDGLCDFQYNVGKGLVSASALLVSAPFRGAQDISREWGGQRSRVDDKGSRGLGRGSSNESEGDGSEVTSADCTSEETSIDASATASVATTSESNATENESTNNPSVLRNAVTGAVVGFGAGVIRGVVGSVVLGTAGCVYGTAQLVRGLAAIENVEKASGALDQGMNDIARLGSEPLMNLILQKNYGLEDCLEREDERVRVTQAVLARENSRSQAGEVDDGAGDEVVDGEQVGEGSAIQRDDSLNC